jgi:hypothetical protein
MPLKNIVTSSLTAQLSDLPPGDTIEVSVFGKGIGECVVVHLGAGEWLIADSLIDSSAGCPVALDYLRGIGVDVTTAVKLVVVTHWHRDHTDGIAELFEQTASAEVVFSQALRSAEFRELLGRDKVLSPANSSLAEMRSLIEILRERRRKDGQQPGGPTWALENRLLRKTPDGDVFSLSPSDGAISLALREIRSLITSEGASVGRLCAQRPNETCIVLSVRLGDKVVILGADLEAGRDATLGWKAIAGSRTRPHMRASCFKIPHHGSSNAHEPLVWETLFTPSRIGVLTPYRALRNPIPTSQDIERLLTCTTQLYCAGGLAAVRGPRRPSSVEKLIAGRLHSAEARMGHVRARFPPAGTAIVDTFGSAKRL